MRRGGRYELKEHFTRRMDHRGLFWPDVLAVLDAPSQARADGFDHVGRSRWIVEGPASDGVPLGLVCAIGREESGELTVFITLFWEP